MVKLIRGLQAVYADEVVRGEILALIGRDVLGGASPDRGRLGLDLWSIFVLVATRLALNADYDRLEDLAENHRLLRMAMGLGSWQDEVVLDWTRIWRNVAKVRPETLDAISRRVVHLGHQAAPQAAERMRSDSFVMQTTVHHPSDIRQVGDGVRCLIRHATRLADLAGSTLLRQHRHLAKQGRSLTLIASRASGSCGRGREERLATAVRALCAFADARCDQALALLDQVRGSLPGLDPVTQAGIDVERSRVYHFLSATATCVQVAHSRLVLGGEVPLSDRLFSVFESHTELINRGKVPVPVEFGHRVLVVEDAAGCIVHAHVMANGRQDRDVAGTVTRRLTRDFPTLQGISFDRGFHSPEYQERLATLLPHPCLPTTGIAAAAKQAATVSPTWRRQRRAHPGIEAAIGGLEDNRGCRRCGDKGRHGYRRYLVAAVLAHNLISLGRLRWAEEDPDCRAARTRRIAA